MKFNDLDIVPELKTAIERLGFESCTPIQAAVLPLVKDGKDISGLAQTGTGKTGAFLIPLLHRWIKSEAFYKNTEAENTEAPKDVLPNWKKYQFCLVLVPTRELADQVYDTFNKLKGDTNLKGTCVYGGVDIEQQKKKLKDGVDFLIATPGRLIDLYKSHCIDLKQVRAIVFDEADRMFDMGFKDDMIYLLKRMPEDRQFLVFSATLNFDVLTVAYQSGANPIEVHIDKDNITADNINHALFHVGTDEKGQYLLSLLKRESPKQTIIFSNFRHNIEKLVTFLNRNGLPAMGISSLLTQPQRNRVMEQFKAENSKNILVATDVAARGLDVKGVDLVVNYELPDDAENYVHRIGRTGRAGASGKAYSFVSDLDLASLERIESYLKAKVSTEWLDDADLVKEFEGFPSIQPRRDGGYKKDFRDNKSRGNKKEFNKNNSKNKRGGKSRGYDNKKSGYDPAKSGTGKHPAQNANGKKPFKKSNTHKKFQQKPRPNKSGYKPRNTPVKKPSAVASLLKKLVFWK
ncbi:MAG: DEAD/DEAH box helicase [Bdellovibrionales bacterium]|nr:DEAD/DEAH box helicase [Bdellovibrionales bacterium]